jgi:hypothetical protein
MYIEHLSKDLNINAKLIAKEAYMEKYDERIRYGFSGTHRNSIEKHQPRDKKEQLEQQMLTYYIKHINTLTPEERSLIENFQYSEVIQPSMDYLKSFFKAHTIFSKQELIEDADIEIARQLIDLIEQSEQLIDNVDLNHIMNLVILMNLEEQIEKINAQMKVAPEKALATKWQELILQRNKIKKKTEKRN